MEPVKRQCTEASQDSQQSGYSYDSDDDLVEDSGFAVEAEDSDDGHAGGADSDDEVMDAAALAREQDAAIGRVAELFDQPRTTAAALLRHFKWREETLTERYFEDASKVLAAAGIAAAAAPAGGASTSVEDVICGVCFCESALAETSAADCGHKFCNDCWSGHIKAQIGDGASSIGCMAEKCAVALSSAVVQGLASADDWAKFSRFSQASFVNDNPFLKWCPAAGCGKAVKASRTGAHEVSCSCGMIFCFGCSVEAHYPLSCAQLQAWDEKNKSDSETAKYIKANTKKCPKCQTPIEKNGGCNWINCKCGHAFCYFCFNDDPGHHNQPCNRPPEKGAVQSKLELEKYLHYFERYEGHEKSQAFEGELRASTKAKIEAKLGEDGGQTYSEVVYLAEACEQLILCRRALKNTYAYAYFLEDNTAAKAAFKSIFEDAQGQLDLTTEALSGMLEAEEPPARLDVVNKASEAKLRLQRLKESVENRQRWTEQPQSYAAAGSSSGAPIDVDED